MSSAFQFNYTILNRRNKNKEGVQKALGVTCIGSTDSLQGMLNITQKEMNMSSQFPGKKQLK